MKDVVLDLETFGTAPDSAVVSIGAVSLDGARFYRVIGNPSGALDVSAVRWWTQQRVEVQNAIATGDPEREVLAEFARWLGEVREDGDGQIDGEPTRIWGSEDFDTVILANAYRRNGMNPPWYYQEPRGLRTVLDLAGVDEDSMPWEGIEHIAIDCARHAATALELALSRFPAPVVELDKEQQDGG